MIKHEAYVSISSLIPCAHGSDRKNILRESNLLVVGFSV